MVGLIERAGGMFARIKTQATGVRLPKIGKQDALAAVTTGVANVPDGMASAVLAGVNPVYGIYSLIVGTPVAALGSSTQLMTASQRSSPSPWWPAPSSSRSGCSVLACSPSSSRTR
jgi:hypothetical protein